MISASALGAEGRGVRCGKCSHKWHASPPRDSLDDLKTINVTDTASPASTKIVDEPPAFLKTPPPAPPESAPSSGKKFVVTFLDVEKQKKLAAVLVGLAIIFVTVWGLVGIRHHLPILHPFFVALGWHDVVPEPQLVFERPQLNMTQGRKAVSVNVINLSTESAVLPPVKVRFYKGKQLMQEEIIRADQDKINAESSVTITHGFERLPEGLTELRFSFINPE